MHAYLSLHVSGKGRERVETLWLKACHFWCLFGRGVWLVASSSLTDISPFISGRWLQALSGHPKHKVGGSRESTSGLCSSLARRSDGQLGRRHGPGRLGFTKGEGRAATTSGGHLKHAGCTLARVNVKIVFCVHKVFL